MKKNLLNLMKLSFAMMISLFTYQSYAQTNQTQWAQKLGSTGAETVNGIAHDALGNSYVTGSLLATTSVTLSNGSTQTLTVVGSSDIFIAKLNSLGEFVWVKVIGDTGADVGFKIKVDFEGNVVAAGHFTGSVLFPNSITEKTASNGAIDCFVLKLSPAGDFMWLKTFGGLGQDYAYALDIDNLGDVYVGGRFAGTVDFNPGTETFNLLALSGSYDAFVLKLTKEGDFVLAKSFGGAGWDVVNGLAVDVSKNIILTGRFDKTSNFNTNPAGTPQNISSNNDSQDAYILKLDANGDFVWFRTISSSNNDIGNDVAVDKAGNVFATGYFYDAATIHPLNVTANALSTTSDIYILKFSPSGSLLWNKTVGSISDNRGEGIRVDGNGDVYVTGRFAQDAVNFGNNILLSAGGQFDAFLVKIHNNGITLWAERFGGIKAELGAETAGADSGFAISVDNDGNVYTAGTFGNAAIFDFPTKGIKYVSAGSTDVFIHKLSQIGFTLPVALSKFYVQEQFGGNKIVWETVTETNNSHFEIERSLDGLVFNSIKSVQGIGTSSSLQSYNFIDTDINYPTIYYRLKQVDFNGSTTYSKVEAINSLLQGQAAITVYPNPVVEKLIVKTTDTFKKASFKVINAEGKTVLEMLGVNGQEIGLDLSSKPNGLYLIEIKDGENNIVRKFFKQ